MTSSLDLWQQTEIKTGLYSLELESSSDVTRANGWKVNPSNQL